jgi:hypothetical protein
MVSRDSKIRASAIETMWKVHPHLASDGVHLRSSPTSCYVARLECPFWIPALPAPCVRLPSACREETVELGRAGTLIHIQRLRLSCV